ncbi:MAG TPA: hypothetical protein VM029_04000, partial [Opitutaceae bacterium]|nr:hypothetical protein [Opitutaceae bacterium]
MKPELSPTLPSNQRASHQLFRIGLIALVGGTVLLCHRSPLQDGTLVVMGAAAIVLAAFPALEWARKAKTYFPIFEMFMLTSIPFYAMPLLAGHSATIQFSEDATLQAATSLLLFQVVATVIFLGVRGRPSRNRALTGVLLPEKAVRYAIAGMWLNTIHIYLSGFTTIIPYDLRSIVRAAFFGIGTVSLFIETRKWGAGTINQQEKFVIALNMFLQLVFLFRELYLIVGISMLLLALFGYVSASRRLPIVFIALALPVIGILHNGKSTMRAQYWSGRMPLPTIGEVPAFFERWVEAGLAAAPEAKSQEPAGITGRLFERASLFQMLCLTTERTPSFVPFLAGETYKDIPAQIVPRILWPGKPSSLLSNLHLAIHYGLVDPNYPINVSIAFGMVAEAYANFGLIGCGILGAVLGFAYKRISLLADGAPQFSALGLLTILLAAWSFQVEQVLASWFVSLLQAAAVVIGVP